jgi:hypothetical protein
MTRLDLDHHAPQSQETQILLQRRHLRRGLIDCGKHPRPSRRGPERGERDGDRINGRPQFIRHTPSIPPAPAVGGAEYLRNASQISGSGDTGGSTCRKGAGPGADSAAAGGCEVWVTAHREDEPDVGLIRHQAVSVERGSHPPDDLFGERPTSW